MSSYIIHLSAAKQLELEAQPEGLCNHPTDEYCENCYDEYEQETNESEEYYE
jgi:hypothetical protein